MRPKHILAKNFIPANEAYFHRIILPTFTLTQQKSEAIPKCFSVAGLIVRVVFYDPEVAKVLSQALKHNEVAETSDTDLTIHTWDSRHISELMPAPWDGEDFQKEDRSPTGDFFGVYIGGEESLNFYDSHTKTGYFWSHDVNRLTDTVLGAPFRTILHWFLAEAGIHLWHGAVIGEGGKSLLLTAKSGSGKSTTALSCVLAGMDYLADDYVAIQCEDQEVVAHSLYHSAKMTSDSTKLFPELTKLIWNKNFGEHEKAVIFLKDGYPAQVQQRAPLQAILIPRIHGGTTSITPASAIDALVAIAPTTLLQLPLADSGKLTVFKDIVQRLPCYFLDLGDDIRGVPDQLKTFIRDNAGT